MRLSRGVEMPAGAHPISRAAIAFFVDMKTVAAGGQSGNLRLDDDFVALLRKGDRAGRGVALGRFQPRDGGLTIRGQRGANGERTDRRCEYQTLHGTSWTTNDIAVVELSMHRMISERPCLAKRRGKARRQIRGVLLRALRRIAPHITFASAMVSTAQTGAICLLACVTLSPCSEDQKTDSLRPSRYSLRLGRYSRRCPEESAKSSGNHLKEAP